MGHSIRFFGGRIHGHMTSENGRPVTSVLDRDLGFDRDWDGCWLVWASRHADDADPGDGTAGDHTTGAIVVKDPTVIAFIEMLGDLIADSSMFHDEPTFTCPHDDSTS